MSEPVFRLCRTANGTALCGHGFALCRSGSGGGVPEPDIEEYWIIDGMRLDCTTSPIEIEPGVWIDYGEGGRVSDEPSEDGYYWDIYYMGRNEDDDMAMMYEITVWDLVGEDEDDPDAWEIVRHVLVRRQKGGPGLYAIDMVIEGSAPSSIEFFSNMYEMDSEYEFEVETTVQVHLSKARINESKPYLGLVWDNGLNDWVYDGHDGFYYENIITRNFVQRFRIPVDVMESKTAGGAIYQYDSYIAHEAGDYYTEDVEGSETEIWDNGCLLWNNGTYLIPVLVVGSPMLNLTATTVDVIYDDWSSISAGSYVILAGDERFPPDLRGHVLGMGGKDIREILVDFTIGLLDYWVRKQEWMT